MKKFIALGATILWGVEESVYFGWHWIMPKSEAELFCDGIGFILIVLTMIVMGQKK